VTFLLTLSFTNDLSQVNVLYVLCGIAFLIFGTWLTIRQVKIFLKKEQDELGNDVKGLGVGIMTIMIGIYIISKYI
jgi:hypothetical protein